MLLLYDEEEQSIGRTLRRWSDDLRNRQTTVLGRHTAFVQGVAGLVTRRLDRLFGPALLSARAFSVSLLLSSVSVILGACLVALYSHIWIFLLAPPFLILTLYFLAPNAFRLERTGWELVWLLVWLVATNAMAEMIGIYASIGHWSVVAALSQAVRDSGFLVALVAAAVLCDFVFVAATQAVLSVCRKLGSAVGVASLLTVSFATALSIVVLPLSWASQLGFFTSHGVTLDLAYLLWLTGMSNLVDLAVASSVFALGLILLVHRIWWPFVNRPFYVFATRAEFRRGLLFVLGIALFTAGLGIAPSPWRVLRKLVVERFVGG